MCLQAAVRTLEGERHKLEQQRRLRQSNLDAVPPLESDLRKLDASVKRNTALIKKLRGINEEFKAGLLEDILRTNQSKVTSRPSEPCRRRSSSMTCSKRVSKASLRIFTVLAVR